MLIIQTNFNKISHLTVVLERGKNCELRNVFAKKKVIFFCFFLKREKIPIQKYVLFKILLFTCFGLLLQCLFK
ncbi:hypothetical protein VC82_773 [Flagellimonas lutaonensis]|uniref:Uncharacterized protein n=1 Tax=Flagellimonas lutaonensis TaxID=516051 RepID=A0A0D5YQ52_9FLAO|nr:hypothetical protein VC82_773 [Allomuricauda lutaonensis]